MIWRSPTGSKFGHPTRLLPAPHQKKNCARTPFTLKVALVTSYPTSAWHTLFRALFPRL